MTATGDEDDDDCDDGDGQLVGDDCMHVVCFCEVVLGILWSSLGILEAFLRHS